MVEFVEDRVDGSVDWWDGMGGLEFGLLRVIFGMLDGLWIVDYGVVYVVGNVGF